MFEPIKWRNSIDDPPKDGEWCICSGYCAPYSYARYDEIAHKWYDSDGRNITSFCGKWISAESLEQQISYNLQLELNNKLKKK